MSAAPVAARLSWAESAPTPAGPSLGIRNAHGLVYDSLRGKTILFGGADSEKVLNDTWEFDGEKWSQVAVHNSPSPRTFPAMTYDSANHKVLLFGGNRVLFGHDDDDYEFYDDFWEFDGNTWRKVNVPTPSARAEASFVFDRQREAAVLYGGYRIEDGEVRPLSDTWEFRENSWKKVSEGTPSARYGATAAFSDKRGTVVMFGGGIGRGGGETWEWNGQFWRELEFAGTEPRYNAAMIYDRSRQVFIRFGGWDGSKRVNETWQFDEETWKLLDIPGPGARNHTGMIYDEKRKETILFGGHDGEWVFGDTWALGGTAWKKLIAVESQERVDNGH
jgi:hypothetical protein